MGADFTTLYFGTLIAGEGLADGALARCDRKLVAHSAYEEVELVGVCRADVEQLWLQLRYVAVAWILNAHCCLNWLRHENFLATIVV